MNFIIQTIILSILFAVSMKLADLLNEHGLKLFKCSNIIFGIFWGLFGSLLILSDNFLANLWIAALIGWIFRGKEDYLNHGIASGFILTTFVLNIKNFQLDLNLFLTFFISMVLFGLIHDWLSENKKVSKTTSEYFHTICYYTILPIVYSSITKDWIILISFLSFIISYEIVRFWGNRKIILQNL